MNQTATRVESPDQVLHLTCRELHLEVPSTTLPVVTIEAIPPFACKTAVVTTSSTVSVHRAKELAAQQRTPLGARAVGTVNVEAKGNSGSNSSKTPTYVVPLYQACVAYRRPNAYKERISLCIVDDTAMRSRHNRDQHRRRYNSDSDTSRQPVSAAEEKTNVMRVCFVDLVSLTTMSRVLLRCPRTGELLTPTPLFCRYDIASERKAASCHAGNGDQQKNGGVSDKTKSALVSTLTAPNHTHAQHHRRRVVMLPFSAANATYELVTIVTKRARDGDDRDESQPQ